jgi:hypothetical protein
MPREIDGLTATLRRAYSGITVERLRVALPGVDDDGLWCIKHPAALADVRVESSTGDAPFMVESDLAPPTVARTVDDAVRLVVERLGLSIGARG